MRVGPDREAGCRLMPARKKSRRQRLDQHMAGQAEGKPDERVRRADRIGCGKDAMFEQYPHDRVAQRDQSQWDAQMDADSAAGRLDFLFEEADEETRTGGLRQWPSHK